MQRIHWIGKVSDVLKGILKQPHKILLLKTASIIQSLFRIGLNKDNINTTNFYSGENYKGKAFFFSKKDFHALISTFVTIENFSLLKDIVY